MILMPESTVTTEVAVTVSVGVVLPGSVMV